MDADAMKLAFIELLDEDAVITKLGNIVRGSIKDIVEDLKATKAKVIKLEEKVNAKESEINNLRTHNDKLEVRIDELEQYSRRSSIRVYGLPEESPGTTDDKLIALCNDHLNLRPPLELEEIEVSHRVGPSVDDKPRPVIVKFVSRRSKARVMTQKRHLKKLSPPGRTAGDGRDDDRYPLKRPVYFQDDLVKSRAQLYYKARMSKKDNKLSDTWTYDGKILIKDHRNRIYEIKSESMLKEHEEILAPVK